MKKLPASLIAFLAKHPTMFAEGWSEKDGFNERNQDGWSHWVYLKPGFHNGDEGSHIIHECSVKEVKKAWRWVGVCTCSDCKKELSKRTT